MSKVSISSALIMAAFCGAVASAGMVGTYALIAPIVAGMSSSAAQVGPVGSGYVPVRLTKGSGGVASPATQAMITCIQQGAVVVETPIGLDGSAQLRGLQTGVHSIFVSGQDGFAALGAWLNPLAITPGGPGSLVDIALVPPPDIPIVQRIIAGDMQGQQSTVPLPGNSYGPPGGAGMQRRDLILGHGFALDGSGAVHGKIIQPHAPTEPETPIPGLDVFFVHSGRIVGQSRTGADGMFRVNGLEAAVHSFVVAGGGAFLALAAEVHASAPHEAPHVTEFTFQNPQETQQVSLVQNQQDVAFQGGETTVASASPVSNGDVQTFSEQFGPEGPPGFGGGGFGGGTGGGTGGGGGGFGGGGLGALAGLAALGAAAAALADDDGDGATGMIPVVSPATP